MLVDAVDVFHSRLQGDVLCSSMMDIMQSEGMRGDKYAKCEFLMEGAEDCI